VIEEKGGRARDHANEAETEEGGFLALGHDRKHQTTSFGDEKPARRYIDGMAAANGQSGI